MPINFSQSPRLVMASLALASIILVSLVTTSVHAADAVKVPKFKPPSTLQELGDRIAKLTDRLDELAQVAQQDPREFRLDIYAKYSTEQLRKRKKKVDVFAEELVEMIKDPNAPLKKVRQRATALLARGTKITQDPDLSPDIKHTRGAKSKRGHFFKTQIVPLLFDKKDARLRKIAHDLLLDVFGQMNHVKGITSYRSDKAMSKTWGPAKKAWNKYLGKR